MFVRPLLFVCLMLFTSLFIQTAQAKDSYTYANLEDVRVSHLYLDLQVDFQKQALIGFAELTLDWQHKERNHITLDTRDLDIKKVYARRADGQRSLANRGRNFLAHHAISGLPNSSSVAPNQNSVRSGSLRHRNRMTAAMA